MLSVIVSVACALAALALAGQYLARLPNAPACPACRSMTRSNGAVSALDRLCALADATPVRFCARCGWAGRMRWKLAAQRAATRRG